MNELRVGDVVRISAVGRRRYPDAERNPHCLTGIVTEIGYYTNVIWSNDEWNNYQAGELELVKENEQRRRKGYGQWLRALESSVER